MYYISLLVSIVISAILLKWMFSFKKDNPFPGKSGLWMVVGGFLSCIVAGFLTIIVALLFFMIRIGPDTFTQIFNEIFTKHTADMLSNLMANSKRTLLGNFLGTLVNVALVEEFCKLFVMTRFTKKPGITNNRFDVVLCSALVGTGFQIWEDLSYASGNLVSAIARALTPFHFVFGVIMGFFYSKGKKTGNKLYYVLALLIPGLIHTLFDFSISSIDIEQNMVVLMFVMMIVMFVLTVVMIIKMNKWKNDSVMNEPFNNNMDI